MGVEAQSAEELLRLLRYQQLDRRNCNEEAMMNLMGIAANELEQLRLDLAQQAINASTIIEQQTEIERLNGAIEVACSEMGCFCDDDDEEECPMCRLEKQLHHDVTARPGYGNHCIYHPGALFVLADGCPTCEKSQ